VTDLTDVLSRAHALSSEQHAIAEALRQLPDAELIAIATGGAVPATVPSARSPRVTRGGRPGEIEPRLLGLLSSTPMQLAALATKAGIDVDGAKNALARLRRSGKVLASHEGWTIATPIEELAKRHARRLPKSAPTTPSTSRSARVAGPEREEQLLALLADGPKHPAELATSMGFSATQSAFRPIRSLLGQGKIEKVGSGSGVAYQLAKPTRAAARQTGAKKMRARIKGADEEEPAAVHAAPAIEPTRLRGPRLKAPRLLGPIRLRESTRFELPADAEPIEAVVAQAAPAFVLPDEPGLRGDSIEAARARLRREVELRQPIRYRDTLSWSEPRHHHERQRHSLLIGLLKSGSLFGDGVGGDTLLATRRDLLPKNPSSRGLPMFALGFGPRRDDCRSYAGCLDRFVKADFQISQLRDRGRSLVRDPNDRSSVSGHCPADCAHYEAIPRDAAIALAMSHCESPIARAATH
jgi:hypothetical protein